MMTKEKFLDYLSTAFILSLILLLGIGFGYLIVDIPLVFLGLLFIMAFSSAMPRFINMIERGR